MKIPSKIFQTWKTHHMDNQLENLTTLWKVHNPKYEYGLFDNAECDRFIKENFDSNVYSAYVKLLPGALKADLWRYCVLYKYGGVYVDIDTMCMNSLNKFLKNYEFVTAVDLNKTKSEGEHNLFNTFIASIPQHPILKGCIDRITLQVLGNIKPQSALDITGPGVLGREFNLFMNRPENDSVLGMEGEVNQSIYLLYFKPEIEYIGIKEGEILFQNKNGNSEIKKFYDDECRKMNIVSWLNNPCWSLTDIKYEKYLDRRSPTFIKTYELVKQSISNNATYNIVELGTSRSFVTGGMEGCLSADPKYWNPENPEVWDWGAGIFTKVFADSLDGLNYKLYSIDPSEEAISICNTMMQNNPNVNIIKDYSTNFLDEIPFKIDLLYMDHMESSEEACIQHLKDSKLIVENDIMATNGLILIDDVGDNITLTKGKYSIPYLLENGYELIMHEYQVLLRRK